MSDPTRQLPLNFIRHMIAIGQPSGGGEAVMILLGDDPQEQAIALTCPHTCDTFIEILREARAAIRPHPTGEPDESDEYYSEEVSPGAVAKYLGGEAQRSGPLSVGDVERAVARHERAARMLRK